MATGDAIGEFLRWASSEAGRKELIDAINKSDRYADCSAAVAKTVLDDHLNTINGLGSVVGAPRVSILVKSYAPQCPSAPHVPDTDLAKLEARYDPATYR